MLHKFMEDNAALTVNYPYKTLPTWDLELDVRIMHKVY
jgi:hypothetical protein